MQLANIKIPSSMILKIKKVTGERTGQKAIHKALVYFMREARQRNILKVLNTISFESGYDPVKLRQCDR